MASRTAGVTDPGVFVKLWTGPVLGLGVGLACLLLATAATVVAVPGRIDVSLIRRE